MSRFPIKEFWFYIRSRKKFWLLPAIIVVILFGGLIALGQGSAVAPLFSAIIKCI